MSAINCQHCGLVALTHEGGSPVEVRQTEYVPQYEHGAISRTDRFAVFAATYCSLACLRADLDIRTMRGDA